MQKSFLNRAMLITFLLIVIPYYIFINQMVIF
jgi:hypothetical protein